MRKIIPLTIAVFFMCSVTLSAEIKALKVKGKVAYKITKDWAQLKEGQVLPEGVRISTGANSSAELGLNSLDHKITVKPYTVIQVFSKTDDTKSDTNVGLKRGNIIVKVPKDKKVKTVFKVTTPIATSSVRGTEEDIFYGPDSGMIVKVLEGIIEGTNRIGRVRVISGREVYVQLWGEPDSEFLLGDLRSETLIDVNGSGMTEDETGVYNNDQTGTPDGDTGIIDRKTGRAGSFGVQIIWP